MARSKNFAMQANVRMPRTRWRAPHGVKTSMSVGKLYPIYIKEVLPGDNWSTKMTCVSRVTSSFLKPVMDNAYMDVYHFFVPLRLLYDDLEEVFGKASPSMYRDGTLATIPHFEQTITIGSKTVGDYLGLPVGNIPSGATVLPFRAFAKIYDDWFRNENVTDEVYLQTGEVHASELPNTDPWGPNNYTGQLPYVGKHKDYFTSALPKTQKGDPVSISIGASAPVWSTGEEQMVGVNTVAPTVKKFGTLYTPSFSSDINSLYMTNPEMDGDTDLYKWRYAMQGDTVAGTPVSAPFVADLSSANPVTVNDLRFAFQMQKMLERDALYGSRYNEYLLAHFGVSSPDSRLQFSEYLGGGRIPIQVQQVAQTSQATEDSPLANVAGFSLSNGQSRYSKGFVEHGYIITVACIRTVHTYQQGVPKMWSRVKRADFYDPLFATLGEQPIYKTELYAGAGSSLTDTEQVFGYKEAWAEYRFLPNIVTGEMRSAANSSLDIWHFADKYESAPTLSDQFVMESPVNIDRTLSVPSESIDNFICDFYFDTSCVRVMPLDASPGLIDHH